MKLKSLILATAMFASAPLFAAAAEYSIADLQDAGGTAMVRVKQVLANCSRGEPHVLFNDESGALVSVDGLQHIDDFLNAKDIPFKTSYENLHVVLGETAFLLKANGIPEEVTLKSGLHGNVVQMTGQVKVTRNFVGSASGCRIKRPE